MTDLPTGITYQGIYCYQSKDDPQLFYFIPGDPGPETDLAGRPTLLLLVSTQGGILQLGAHWSAAQAVLDQLRSRLAQLNPNLDRDLIRLASAPVAQLTATLNAGDGNGNTAVLATSATSGFYPYNAVYNVTLNADQKATAMEALNGREGFLTVQYQGALGVDEVLTASIEGDVASDLAALGSDPTLEQCSDRIDLAFHQMRLTWKRDYPADASSASQAEVEGKARQKADLALQQMARQAPPPKSPSPLSVTLFGPPPAAVEAHLQVSASITITANVPLARTTDVSGWFSSGEGADHIHVVDTIPTPAPTPTPEPQSGETAKTVRLGFEPTDAPIAFIEVVCGSDHILLKPPSFSSADLADSIAGPLTVNTNYTDGGPAYTTTLETIDGSEWVISFKEVGMVQVVIDATPVQQSGASDARVRVRYRAAGDGTDDQRTFFFRHDKWTDQYLIVTRSDGLGGTLDYDWQITAADGTSEDHPTTTADSEELRPLTIQLVPGK